MMYHWIVVNNSCGPIILEKDFPFVPRKGEFFIYKDVTYSVLSVKYDLKDNDEIDTIISVEIVHRDPYRPWLLDIDE